MKASTRAKWTSHVQAWAASGESCRAYAARVGVNASTLASWKSRLSREAADVADERPRFVELTTVDARADDGVIELRVGSVDVRVRGPVDARALSRVLDVLEARR